MATKIARGQWFLLPIAGILGLLPLAGCSSPLSCVPVSGTVTLDGQPLEGGYRILFTPDASRGNTIRAACSGRVQNGRYELISVGVTRSETGEGAPPGWYKVSLQTTEPGSPKTKQELLTPPKVGVNRIYFSPDKTPLEVEIVANPQPGAYDLKLTR